MDRIPLFPLQAILFPHTDFGVHVFEERYRTMVGQCLDGSEGFGVVLIRRGREVAGPAEPHDVGTYAHICAYARLLDGRYLLEVEGTRRFRIHRTVDEAPYPQADVTWLDEPIGDFGAARAAGDLVGSLFAEYRARNGLEPMTLPGNPVARSHVAAWALDIDVPEKQTLLETESADERLAREVSILRREIALIEHLVGQPPGRWASRPEL